MVPNALHHAPRIIFLSKFFSVPGIQPKFSHVRHVLYCRTTSLSLFILIFVDYQASRKIATSVQVVPVCMAFTSVLTIFLGAYFSPLTSNSLC